MRPRPGGAAEAIGDAVGGEVDIGFEVVEPEVDRSLERRHRVLRPVAGQNKACIGPRCTGHPGDIDHERKVFDRKQPPG